MEPLENKGEIFSRYTDAGILNLGDGIVPAYVETNENPPAGLCVLHCIIDQDEEQATNGFASGKPIAPS